MIKFVVDHWPVQLFGEEPDGAAHRWLQAQAGVRDQHFPEAYRPGSVAYDWTALRRLYEYCQQVQRVFGDSTDAALAEKVAAAVDSGLTEWFSEIDAETIQDVKHRIHQSGAGERLERLLRGLPPTSRATLDVLRTAPGHV